MSPLSFASHPSSRARARALHRPLLSFLSLVSAPADWTAAAMLSSCRHTIVAPPLVSSAVPLMSTPFGPRLTSPVPSSSYRTRRCPPRPLELCHCLGTPPGRVVSSAPPPPAISGENSAAPPCPMQPSSLPRGLPTGHATPRPLAKSRQPCHRTAGVARLGHSAARPGQQ
jgi:hypothetical protein